MKKTQNTIFGFLGLLTVVAMTVIAAVIPSPGASANSMTDTINVRVVGSVTNVKFKKPSENTITTNDVISFAFDYENASSARLALSYTNKNGDTVSLPDYESYPDLDYGAGTENGSFNIPAHGLSYGKYVLSLYAKGAEGTEVFYDSVSVEYIPVIAEAEQNEDDGLVGLDLSDFTDEVEKVDIYVDGELIATVDKKDFDETVKLDFGERTSGEYKIEVIAKDAENKTTDNEEKSKEAERKVITIKAQFDKEKALLNQKVDHLNKQIDDYLKREKEMKQEISSQLKEQARLQSYVKQKMSLILLVLKLLEKVL